LIRFGIYCFSTIESRFLGRAARQRVAAKIETERGSGMLDPKPYGET